MFLSRPEIEELTGRVHADAQCAWLAKHGWPFATDADGRPKVARAVFDARLGIKTLRRPPERSPRLDLVR